eukprot:jgi/Mesvir1/18598/Mv17107-RA.1
MERITEYAMLSSCLYKSPSPIQTLLRRKRRRIRWTHNNKANVYDYPFEKRQVLVVRGEGGGAWSSEDWEVSAELVPSATLGVRVHKGYLESAMELYQHVRTTDTLNMQDGWVLDVTGHSSGGAVGVIVAALLAADNVHVGQVITFGQPKITDAQGARVLGESIRLLRLVGDGDEKWTQPPSPYAHFGIAMSLQNWDECDSDTSGGAPVVSSRRYLSCTTRPHKQVAASLGKTALSLYGNASSSHVTGKASHDIIEQSRRDVAKGVGASPSDVVFTAGATESNNLIIHSVLEKAHWKGVVLTSRIEHPSIIQPLLHIHKVTKGAVKVVQLPVDGEGFVKMESLHDAVRRWKGRIKLCTIIYANNEIGTIQNFAAIRRAVGKDVHIHADTTQVAGKAPIQGRRYMDSFTVSGHKIHGMKGIGALVVRGGIGDVKPMMFGGGQEHGVRPGTESPPLIASLAQAVHMNMSRGGRKKWKHVLELTEATREGLARLGAVFNGPEDASKRMGNLISFAIPGTDGRELVKHLSKHDICANVGSACSKAKRSRVLQAIGIPEAVEKGTVRIGLSIYTTHKEVDYLLKCLKDLLIK